MNTDEITKILKYDLQKYEVWIGSVKRESHGDKNLLFTLKDEKKKDGKWSTKVEICYLL